MEPVSPVDITAGAKRARTTTFAVEEFDEKSDMKATTRSMRTNSTTSSTASVGPHRKTRFAEATSVFSPASGPGEHDSPFEGRKMDNPADVGFGYIANSQPVEQHAIIRGDLHGPAGPGLKSALKTPGTSSRLLNPLSPTFREEQMLDKEEAKTEVQQAKDLVSVRLRPPSK